jgi:hypothetical protein
MKDLVLFLFPHLAPVHFTPILGLSSCGRPVPSTTLPICPVYVLAPVGPRYVGSSPGQISG